MFIIATSVAAAAPSDISPPSCCVSLTFTQLSCYSHRLVFLPPQAVRSLVRFLYFRFASVLYSLHRCPSTPTMPSLATFYFITVLTLLYFRCAAALSGFHLKRRVHLQYSLQLFRCTSTVTSLLFFFLFTTPFTLSPSYTPYLYKSVVLF